MKQFINHIKEGKKHEGKVMAYIGILLKNNISHYEKLKYN